MKTRINNIIMAIKPLFLGCGLINKKIVLNNIDQIYASLPVEVIELRKKNNNFDLDPKIYDDLKNFEIFLDQQISFYPYVVVSSIFAKLSKI